MNTVTHVVMWRLGVDLTEKPQVQKQMRERLESLVGVIPGLRSITVVSDLGDTEANFDVMLISEHDSTSALAEYQAHPAHLEVASWVKTVVTERAALDHFG